MEVAFKEQDSIRTNPVRRSSFDCDSLAMDTLLGLCSFASDSHALRASERGTQLEIGNTNVRLDGPHLDSPSRQASQIYAPLEVVPADNHSRDLVKSGLSLDEDSGIRRERLFRLLAQQQSWYDAQQQAAAAAEQHLSLCEHHQQQWLHLNQQSHQVLPTHQQ